MIELGTIWKRDNDKDDRYVVFGNEFGIISLVKLGSGRANTYRCLEEKFSGRYIPVDNNEEHQKEIKELKETIRDCKHEILDLKVKVNKDREELNKTITEFAQYQLEHRQQIVKAIKTASQDTNYSLVFGNFAAKELVQMIEELLK